MISIIIPTLDEPMIGEIVESIPKKIENENVEVIVIDKSTKPYVEDAKKAGARVIRQKSKGKAAAMREGIKHSRGDKLILMDGDGTHPVDRIPQMIKLLKKSDMVVATQWFPQSLREAKLVDILIGSIYLHLARVLTKRFAFKTTEPITGFRAIRKKDWNKLNIEGDGFLVETEMEIKAASKKFKIAELGIPFSVRIIDSKFMKSPDEWIRITKYIVKNEHLIGDADVWFEGPYRFVQYH